MIYDTYLAIRLFKKKKQRVFNLFFYFSFSLSKQLIFFLHRLGFVVSLIETCPYGCNKNDYESLGKFIVVSFIIISEEERKKEKREKQRSRPHFNQFKLIIYFCFVVLHTSTRTIRLYLHREKKIKTLKNILICVRALKSKEKNLPFESRENN